MPVGDAALRICIGSEDFFGDVCRAIERLANHHGLPPAFFARLIWQESRFDPSAISRAGAQGIAQFMPGTARLRGLRQALQPAEALAHSAEYLRFLRDKFGNLGLAAAAYNSGEGRVSRWQARGGLLPSETRNYVLTITGAPVDSWLVGTVADVDYSLQPDSSFQRACEQMAEGRPTPPLMAKSADWKPWGVLLAQDFSPAAAAAKFDRTKGKFPALLNEEAMLLLTVRNPSFGPRPRHSAMIGRDSRDEADTLCQDLRAAGGSCVVVRN
ncbi:MAG TPA: transglycosylase SLT domain-containing protein [Devosiaceae bacterium]|jgi:hypothetical protein|nr:transglycosylase SLT domain-containing protein [Devosiaceae bacterium]